MDEPPHNLEAEMSVLGALLLGGDTVGEICQLLLPEDFYRAAHRQVYSAIVALHSERAEIEGISVAEELRRRGSLAEAGGEAYLMTLAETVPSAASAAWHAKIVREKADLRRLMEVSQDMAHKARQARGSVCDLLAEHQEEVGKIAARARPHRQLLADLWVPIGSLEEVPAPPRWLFRVPTRDGQPAPPDGEGGLMRRGAVASLVGAGGVGKTFCILDACIAVAGAGKWLNYFPVENPGRVLALIGEEDRAEAQRRIYYATRHLDADARRLVESRLVVVPMKGKRCGLLRPGAEWPEPTQLLRDLEARLRSEAGPSGWALIAIEPLSRFAGVPLDVATDNATAIIEVAEQFTEMPGTPAVLLGIHSNKASRREGGPIEVRGPSALTDGVRVELHLYRDRSGTLLLHAAKSNYTRFMPPPGIELVVGDHGVLLAAPFQGCHKDSAATGAEVKLAALAQDIKAILEALAKGPASSIDAAVTRAGINLQRGRAAFRVAMDDGRIINTGTSKKPSYAGGGEPPRTPRPDVGRPGPLDAAGRPQRPDGVPDVSDARGTVAATASRGEP